MTQPPTLFWFRDDLRLADNPGLAAAAARARQSASGQTGGGLAVVYVLDDETPEVRPLGGAARWWLDKSLRALGASLKARGLDLILRRGSAETVIPKLVKELGAGAVVWNRRYAAAATADDRIEAKLRGQGVAVESFHGKLLAEPADFRTGSGEPYKVFTPFFKALRQGYRPPNPVRLPATLTPAPNVRSDAVDDWGLHPEKPDWSVQFGDWWTPGEAAAHRRLDTFLKDDLVGYADARDLPANADGCSRLSPHLRFGEIGPAQVWRAVEAAGRLGHRDGEKFLSELGWRDFCWRLLDHDPDMATKSWRREYERVDWRKPGKHELTAWQTGKTGFPIVDAGMRQLWSIGWMHNRVRMIAASFLAKDMLAHWSVGEAWFWDTLVDADEASNAANWQWVAGTGADAAPYFRVLNPTLQGEKFDPTGDYVRAWVPELDGVSAKAIHEPGESAATYPRPILDHKAARARVLDAFAAARAG